MKHKGHKETMRASWFNRASPGQKIAFLQELEVGYVKELNLQASQIERQQRRILELESKSAKLLAALEEVLDLCQDMAKQINNL